MIKKDRSAFLNKTPFIENATKPIYKVNSCRAEYLLIPFDYSLCKQSNRCAFRNISHGSTTAYYLNSWVVVNQRFLSLDH